jgi:hypothetical protein
LLAGVVGCLGSCWRCWSADTFFVSCSCAALCAARPGDELGGGGSILPMRGRGGVHVRLTGCHVIRGFAADVIERTPMLAVDVGPSHRRWEDQRTGSDTLHVETGADAQEPEPTHVESTQGYSLASQRRSRSTKSRMATSGCDGHPSRWRQMVLRGLLQQMVGRGEWLTT